MKLQNEKDKLVKCIQDAKRDLDFAYGAGNFQAISDLRDEIEVLEEELWDTENDLDRQMKVG